MEIEFFNKVLNHLPSHWDRVTYNSKIYEVVPLREYGETRSEYSEVAALFNDTGNHSYKILTIHRIQNPFAYAAFQLRKEQLQLRNYTTKLVRRLVLIKSNQIADAITYNLDKRRTSFSTLTSYSSLNDQVIIVQKQLSSYSEERDSNSYPEYVIYLTNK